MEQMELILSVDTHVVEPTEIRRLSQQCVAILKRLQAGPASNAELALIALKYTSRISDLRAAGYDVKVLARSGGTVQYGLGPA